MLSVNQHTTKVRHLIKRKGLDQSLSDRVDDAEDEIEEGLATALQDPSSATSGTLLSIKRTENIYRTVKVLVNISDMEPPMSYQLSTPGSCISGITANNTMSVIRGLTTTISVGDDSLDTDLCLPIYDTQLVNEIADSIAEYGRFELFGILMEVPVVNEDGDDLVFELRILPLAVAPLVSAKQLVQSSGSELQEAMDFYATMASPADSILTLLLSYLDIHQIERLPELVEAIALQAYAACSEGNRIHTLVVGPPGMAKSKVSEAAKLLQPCYKEAIPAKATPAGLIGRGSSSKLGRRPGLFPCSDQGVFIVQDHHQCSTLTASRLSQCLASVMQGGYVEDASVSMTRYLARCSVVMDANRASEMKGGASDGSSMERFIKDTKLQKNILTRFTNITELHRDVITQLEVSRDMVLKGGSPRDPRPLRLVQVALAELRHRHETVLIPDDVRAMLAKRLNEATDMSSSRFSDNPGLGDFLARNSAQAMTIVEASARLHDRSIATIEDIDRALPFIVRKTMFFKRLVCGDSYTREDVGAEGAIRIVVMKLKLRAVKGFTVEIAKRICGFPDGTNAMMTKQLTGIFGAPDAHGRYNN